MISTMRQQPFLGHLQTRTLIKELGTFLQTGFSGDPDQDDKAASVEVD